MTMNELLIVLQIAENLDICVGKSGKWVEGKFLLKLFVGKTVKVSDYDVRKN